MKKTLIALAVLTVSGAVMAQSSVTIYGVADVVILKDKDTSTTLTNGGISGSRLGFKGSEDLGGGLTATFKLEQAINLTSGISTGFSRETSVGLAGGFGTVRIGRMPTAYDDIAGATNPVFDSVLSPTDVFVTTGFTARPDQGVYYATPSFGGFSAAVSYNLEQVAGSQSVLALAATYGAGPLALGVAYQDEGDTKDTTFTRLNASYDLGVAKVLGGYSVVDIAAANTKQYTIGADVPLSANLLLSVGVASTKTDAAKRLTAYSAGAIYSLSKRTSVYGGIYSDNGTVATGSTESRYGVGVKHTF